MDTIKDSSTEEFNTLNFEKRLTALKDTQDSIQQLSTWCLQRREHHKKIVSSWLSVLKRVKIEQRLTLFYLANDVIQYSKRKNYEFVESWGTTLQKATPLVRDDKVKHRILRIFKIWEQRTVYDEEFLTDLTGLLSAGVTKRAQDDDPFDFQPSSLVNKIKQCSVLESDTDLRLKQIHDCKLSISDADALCANLKVLADRRNTDDVQREVDDAIARMEKYTAALQREIVARETLCALLGTAHHYYDTQRGEVKVVANAYKNFGARVRGLKRKLDELIESLPSAPEPKPEPIMSPDESSSPIITPPRAEDVPSPGPDEDLDLPQNEGDASYNLEKTFSASVLTDNNMFGSGFSSFLGSNNPFNFYSDSQEKTPKPVEPIAGDISRGDDSQPGRPDFNINDFFKSLVPDSAINESAIENESGYNMVPPPPPPPVVGYSPSPVPKPMITANTNIPLLSTATNEILPGLELLTPTSDVGIGPVPPPSAFYGSRNASTEEPAADLYTVETNHSWNINSWDSRPMLSVPPVSQRSTMEREIALDTPESPPLHDRNSENVDPIIPLESTISNRPVADIDHRLHSQPYIDVDHRQPILAQITDVDHRSLIPPPPIPPGLFPASDIDHRNLISLTSSTHQPQMHHTQTVDQDYRLPPPPPPPIVTGLPHFNSTPALLISPPTMVPNPSDIVESVDMDLSEDEDMRSDMQFGIHQISPNYSQPPPPFQYNQPQNLLDEMEELIRPINRHFSNNNKVLVGGDTNNHSTVNSTFRDSPNLIRITSVEQKPPEDPPRAQPIQAITSPELNVPLMPIIEDAPFDFKKVEIVPPTVNSGKRNALLPNPFEVKLSEDIEAFSNPTAEEIEAALDTFGDVSPSDILRNPSPPLLDTLSGQNWLGPMGDSNNWQQHPQHILGPRPLMNRDGPPRHFGNFNQGYRYPRGNPRGGLKWRPTRPPRGGNFW